MALSYKKFLSNYLVFFIVIPLVLLAFILSSVNEILVGLKDIYLCSGLLITDFIAVGGIGATLINVTLIIIFNYVLIKCLKISFNGAIFAGVFTMVGFAFFGKTLINTIPLFLGVYLYSLYSKVEFKNYIIVALFSTGIGPLISFIMFGIGLELYFSIPLGIFIGIVVGFFIQVLSLNALRLHRGYNLYNIGFTLGIIAMIFTAIFRALNISLNANILINNSYHWHLFSLFLIVSIFLIVSAFILDKAVIKKYPKLLKRTGRLVTDFVKETSLSVTLLNMGLMGIFALSLTLILQININGAIVAGIMTMLGFASFGKHLYNTLFVILGAILASFIFNTLPKDNITVAIGIFFVSALAPITGQYGIIAGIIAGFMHMLVLPMAMDFQGGFDLFNNGFAAGFVASIVVPIFENFSLKGEQNAKAGV